MKEFSEPGGVQLATATRKKLGQVYWAGGIDSRHRPGNKIRNEAIQHFLWDKDLFGVLQRTPLILYIHHVEITKDGLIQVDICRGREPLRRNQTTTPIRKIAPTRATVIFW